MKVLILIACLAVAVSANKVLWEDFKSKHTKSYKSLIEERYRYQVFLKNLDHIENHNVNYEQGLTTYKKGVNKFADWTREEFKAFLKLRKPSEKPKATETFKAAKSTPKKVDWRDSGAVTGVKDQGNCGGCWSFSTTGSVEGQLKIKQGKLISLSEQNLMDCSGSFGNEGCNGGLGVSAFEYIQENGINSEESYPYEGEDGECRFNSSAIVTKISGYVEIEDGNEKDLLNAVANVGPISVAIDAESNFEFYESGLYHDNECEDTHDALNHEVLVVGYGTDKKGKDYWLVKNSWGESWGEDGYIKMARGRNLCGIATEASYPQLD